MDIKFEIIYLDEAIAFLNSLPIKARQKIIYNIGKSQHIIDNAIFKKISDNIWEFRAAYNGMAYRLFAFWDEERNSMVVATHGITKKKQKTPPKEIAKAETIRQQYINSNKKR